MVSDTNHTEGFGSETERFLFAAAHVGIEMDEFRRSNVGRYLIGRAQDQVEAFSAFALEIPEPDNTEYKRLHMKAAAAQMLMTFIGEAIADGKHAEESLAEMDAQDEMSDGPLD